MRGRQSGRPTKWVLATVNESLKVGKPGITFEVWNKWKKRDFKLGTLTVTVGGLRWVPQMGKKTRFREWDKVCEWLDAPR